MNRRDAIKRTSLMLGVAVTSPVIISLLEGCSPKKTLNWFPKFLSKDQALLVSEMSETILPKTNTPGAKEIGVDAFIDKMVKDIYSKDEQQTFLEGLTRVDQLSEELASDKFIDLSMEDKTKILSQLDAEGQKFDAYKTDEGQPFFSQLKELTLLGYFTSEEIIKNHLEYVPIPTRFDGCSEMQTNQKTIVGNQV